MEALRVVPSVRRMRAFTFVALAVVVVTFAATWLTRPPGGRACEAPAFPASVFAAGLETWGCNGDNLGLRAKRTLDDRVLVFFASAGAVVVLLGFAAALRR